MHISNTQPLPNNNDASFLDLRAQYVEMKHVLKSYEWYSKNSLPEEWKEGAVGDFYFHPQRDFNFTLEIISNNGELLTKHLVLNNFTADYYDFDTDECISDFVAYVEELSDELGIHLQPSPLLKT